MRPSVILLAVVLAARIAAADSLTTRCDSETIHLPALPASFDVRRLTGCGNEKQNDALWHLDRLDSGDGHLDGHYAAERVHALVYILDSGVEKDHSEFADGNVIAGITFPGKNFGSANCAEQAIHPCFDANFSASALTFTHGTGVASMIGGRRVGVAPGASIVSIVTFGVADPAVFVNALRAIVATSWDPATPQVKTAIVNMSNQMGAATTEEERTIHAAFESLMRDMTNGVDRDGNPDPNGKRFFFTISAGNAAEPAKAGADRGQCGPNYEVKLFPASIGPSIAGVITVGGMTRSNTSWSDSCRGDAVELLAPAEDVFVAIPTAPDHYRQTAASGTSWSAPIVAGVAARYLSENPNLTPAELEAKLEASPTAVTDSVAGPSGGRVVFIGAPIVPRRRATRH
jgi:subtilisin family serine protease